MKSKKIAMKCLRALESDNDKLERQRNDRLARVQARLCETKDQLMKNKIKRIKPNRGNLKAGMKLEHVKH